MWISTMGGTTGRLWENRLRSCEDGTTSFRQRRSCRQVVTRSRSRPNGQQLPECGCVVPVLINHTNIGACDDNGESLSDIVGELLEHAERNSWRNILGCRSRS